MSEDPGQRPEESTGPQSPATLPGGSPPPAPYYPPPAARAPGTNGLAVASLVLGILWLWWLGSILAVIFGHVAVNQIDRTGGVQGGRGLAIAGLVLGWIGVGILLLLIVFGGLASLAPF
jgi:uncharacterized protein DUF4190